MTIIVEIIGITCLLFLAYQLLGYLLAKLLVKKLNLNPTKPGEPSFVLSVTYLVVFLAILLAVISWVSSTTTLSTSDYYLALSSTGICSIIWCYFESHLLQHMIVTKSKNIKGWKEFTSVICPIPSSKKVLARKKTLVFSIVFVFTFIFGYMQIESTLNNTPIDIVLTITNATVVTVMIAFDGFVSQLHTLVKEKIEDKKK